MKKLHILPPLTKKYLLERVSQEKIMEFYTKVPVTEDTLIGNSFYSPFREDNNPTCNYWYKEDSKGEIRLKLKDWDGSIEGDIFDIASYCTKIQTRTSQGFKLLLHKIARDFNIHKYNTSQEREILDLQVVEHVRKSELRSFIVHPRTFNRFDKAYWYDRLGISSDLLRLGLVIMVQRLDVEGRDGYYNTIYNYFSKDPAFAYYNGEKNGVKIWKIYFPLRKKTQQKFLTNYSFIQGLHLVESAKIGIITKSYKDVLVYRTFGLIAIAVPSETYLMTKEEFFNFKNKFDIVLTNFDYDPTGIRLANKYKKVHNCQPLMFTKGRFNQPNYGVKDLSEFRELYGYEKTYNLLASLIEKNIDLLDDITNYNYNQLKWIK
jgi:hypothetical protein